MELAIKLVGALGCRVVIHEVAQGGTYTSAPMPVCSSVYLVRCPANAPERDVLRRSPPHWVRRQARVPYVCPALHSAHMLAPAESILPALMHYAGCTYFWN
eukprot:COSAG06_NODE_11577_length_1487_cov_4.568345_1_plen_101_part_00